MSGFDGNLLVKAFSRYRRNNIDWPQERCDIDMAAADGSRPSPKMSALPWNFQKFKGLTFSRWSILDSYMFQKAGLSKLAGKLLAAKKRSGEELEIFKQCRGLCYRLNKDGGEPVFDKLKYEAATSGKGIINKTKLVYIIFFLFR